MPEHDKRARATSDPFWTCWLCHIACRRFSLKGKRIVTNINWSDYLYTFAFFFAISKRASDIYDGPGGKSKTRTNRRDAMSCAGNLNCHSISTCCMRFGWTLIICLRWMSPSSRFLFSGSADKLLTTSWIAEIQLFYRYAINFPPI